MDTASTPYRVLQCSNCQSDTEYYCVSCPCDLCRKCKEMHERDLKTIDHNAVIYPKKISHIPTQEFCVRHPGNVYRKLCKTCRVPACKNCHKKHKKIDLQTAYKTKRQQHRGTIYTIRSENLLYRPVILMEIKADVKTCHTRFSFYQKEMLTKAQSLKNLIDREESHVDFIKRFLIQKIKMNKHIVSIQRYIHKYEQSGNNCSALQFLSFKKIPAPPTHHTLYTSQLSMTESFSKKDVMESLSAIQITERGNRHVGNKYLLKLMSGANFHQSLTVTGVGSCNHISCVTKDRVWVSSSTKIILTNTKGEPLHHVNVLCCGLNRGSHTVNRNSELIYIDQNDTISKLSKDLKTTTSFINRTDFTWKPRCVYSSPSTGDLLVAMYDDTNISKITRYNQLGQLTQTIRYDSTGQELYRLVNYITENNNGDVVVSVWAGPVVVTDQGGKHRFSYTGPPSGSGIWPLGICTDALSHILVCDGKTVQMLDKDGQFLSHLLTKSQEMDNPEILSYNMNTHRLWVGSGNNNKVCIYRYITRQDALTEKLLHKYLNGETV